MTLPIGKSRMNACMHVYVCTYQQASCTNLAGRIVPVPYECMVAHMARCILSSLTAIMDSYPDDLQQDPAPIKRRPRPSFKYGAR